MANTYTQLHVQLVFAVKNRAATINTSWEIQLYKYITGITKAKGHKLLSINGMPDHIHIFLGMRPTESLSDLARDIKANSSKWINEQKFTSSRFEWQTGYGAFSYSKSHVQVVIDYIKNQKEHHRKKSFSEEYKEFLEVFEIEYKEEYLFQQLESK